MSLCVYKRIRSEPVRLNLNGQIIVVRYGQTIIADNSQMMGVPGFAFIRMYEQRDQFVPAKSNLIINKPNPLIDIENQLPMTIEVHNIKNDTFVETNIITQPTAAPIVEEEIKPTKKLTLEVLKTFDNKQWFALKKEDIIKFLEDANIDYKHISSDKWELLKFLKKIIKEL